MSILRIMNPDSDRDHPNKTGVKFIADRDLSALTKYLRMLGLDCTYDGGLPRTQVALLAALENRILLTRTPFPDTKKVQVIQIKSIDPIQSILQLFRHTSAKDQIQPFSRCLDCNNLLERIQNRQAFEIPKSVRDRDLPLWWCSNCRKVYWHGTHVEKMKQRLECLNLDI